MLEYTLGINFPRNFVPRLIHLGIFSEDFYSDYRRHSREYAPSTVQQRNRNDCTYNYRRTKIPIIIYVPIIQSEIFS